MKALCPDWTRAWRGATAVIAASGPSQCQEDLDYVRGRCRVMVINETWRLAPWADALYFCDAAWWVLNGPRDFAGRMIVGERQSKGPLSEALAANVHSVPNMIWDGERIGAGENSGFQTINLLAVWDVKRIVLTGYDMQPRAACNPDAEMHWHGLHDGLNPTTYCFAKWIGHFRRAAPDLAARGVEVLNATRETALDAFPRVELRQAV